MIHTIPYFLQMLVERQVDCIVMLTKLYEQTSSGNYLLPVNLKLDTGLYFIPDVSGEVNVKCDRYWPEESGEENMVHFDHMAVVLLEESASTIEGVVERSLSITSKNQ